MIPMGQCDNCSRAGDTAPRNLRLAPARRSITCCKEATVKKIEWGYLIVSYLFLGGLSAGLYFVSALACLLQKNGEDSAYKRIAKIGALLAPWPVMLGCFLLLFDIGRWYRFWKLFVHIHWSSPMSLGSWLLVAFSLVAIIYLYSWVTAEQRAWIFSRIPKRLHLLECLNRDISSKRRVLALIGLPISVGVGIYTGVLLGAVQSRPFWNTNLVAQLFLFSALSTGCAALLVILLWAGKSLTPSESRLFLVFDLCLLTLELFIVLPY